MDFYRDDGSEIEFNDYINMSEKEQKKIKIVAREYTVGTVELGNDNTFWHTQEIGLWLRTLSREDSTVYFHNLKFDGGYILDYLLNNGFIYTHEKYGEQFSFNCLIDGSGAFYSINIFFDMKSQNKYYKMTILDSMKVLPMSVEKMPKSFGLKNIKKLGDTYDYNKKRPRGYKLTDDEVEYLKNDVLIVSKAIQFLREQNMTKMTTASNALSDYKKTISKNEWKRAFKQLDLETDGFIRKSYKGGFTYLNPIYKERELANVTVMDVNSLYPAVMYHKLLPYGEPIFFEGEYQYDSEHPLFIQRVVVEFMLKPDKIPTIQLKNNMRFIPTEYLTSSNMERVELVLTNVDLKLFLEQYDVVYINYVDGFKFKGTTKLFKTYIDKWSDIKIQSAIDGNDGMYTLSKLMLNSLYGKFGTNPNGNIKIPWLNGDVVSYTSSENDREPLYIPIASFITSYAREQTIRTAQSITDYSLKKYGGDRFVYSDTDSIHTLLSIDELIDLDIDIDETKLGAWDYEGCFERAKYLKPKTYIQENNLKNNKQGLFITCAGMSKGCYPYVTFDNFKTGQSFKGKLMSRKVQGGPVLLPTIFTIN